MKIREKLLEIDVDESIEKIINSEEIYINNVEVFKEKVESESFKLEARMRQNEGKWVVVNMLLDSGASATCGSYYLHNNGEKFEEINLKNTYLMQMVEILRSKDILQLIY